MATSRLEFRAKSACRHHKGARRHHPSEGYIQVLGVGGPTGFGELRLVVCRTDLSDLITGLRMSLSSIDDDLQGKRSRWQKWSERLGGSSRDRIAIAQFGWQGSEDLQSGAEFDSLPEYTGLMAVACGSQETSPKSRCQNQSDPPTRSQKLDQAVSEV